MIPLDPLPRPARIKLHLYPAPQDVVGARRKQRGCRSVLSGNSAEAMQESGYGLRRIPLPRTWVNKGPRPPPTGPGRTFRAVGCKVGAYPVQATIRLKGWSAGCPPETGFTTTVLVFLDYDMVGKPTPAPRAGCAGFHVGVAALFVVEVDHEADRSDTANFTPDSMRTHRA